MPVLMRLYETKAEAEAYAVALSRVYRGVTVLAPTNVGGLWRVVVTKVGADD